MKTSASRAIAKARRQENKNAQTVVGLDFMVVTSI